MANEEHLAILLLGVEVWNQWRATHPDIEPNLNNIDLSGSDLSGANLSNVVFEDAKLYGAILTGADLSRADLSRAFLERAALMHANLRDANLGRAYLVEAGFQSAILAQAGLQEADLTGADLSDADLSGAYLVQANLRQANLEGADLSGATIAATTFDNNNLRDVRGLTTVRHLAPSTIGIDTLYKSGGKIPEAFLRGCGVPESLIEYLPSLIGAMEPIQFYSCFISYSSKDEEFAKRLHSRMRDNNLRVWFANKDLKGGHKLLDQIDEAIRVYDKFIIVLSPESLRSKWVMNEVRRTRKAELTNNQRKFFPIALMDYRELEVWECIDPQGGTDLAAEIREYYVPDFRDWRNYDSFEKAFAQLLEGLKAVDAPPAPRIEPKDMPQEPEKIIARLKQRLAILEEQAAITGISVRPEVAIEIGDLRKEISRLEG